MKNWDENANKVVVASIKIDKLDKEKGNLLEDIKNHDKWWVDAVVTYNDIQTDVTNELIKILEIKE